MPTKEQVRDWMQNRSKGRDPLPDAVQIRRELDWKLIEAKRVAQERSSLRGTME